MEKRFWTIIVGLGAILIFLGYVFFREGWFEADAGQESYPAPRFPSYLRPPKSVTDLMPSARAATQQTAGRTPLGLAKPGQKVLIMVPSRQDTMVIQAILAAFKERGVEAHSVFEHEVRGVPREQALAEKLQTGEDGWTEICFRAPDVCRFLPEQLKSKNVRVALLAREKLKDYLDNHPYDVVFAGLGGRTQWKTAMRDHGNKLYGNWIYTNHYDLLSRVPSFPSDVWRLLEERTIEPLAWTEEARVTDPEGTNIGWKVSELLAQQWAKGSYQQGHLYMYPFQATGRFPYSVLKYPDTEKEYIPAAVPEGANGVIAGTTGHFGYFPQIKVYIKDSYIEKVEAGGKYGDVIRALLNVPALRDTQYPYLPRPGYWFLWEAGLGTNPKFFRPVPDLLGSLDMPNLPERNADGVIHWGFGAEVQHDPSGKWEKFGKENKVPWEHSFHIHNLLPTYRVKIRGAGQWLTVIDKGKLAALDSFEVRALASRYGDPKELLKEDWVPDIPGINVPGDYQKDFAKEPWKYVKRQLEAIQNGSYKYFK